MNDYTDPDVSGNGNGHHPNGSGEPPAMLEGMKVLFDDKVSLYPVDVVAMTPNPSEALRYGV